MWLLFVVSKSSHGKYASFILCVCHMGYYCYVFVRVLLLFRLWARCHSEKQKMNTHALLSSSSYNMQSKSRECIGRSSTTKSTYRCSCVDSESMPQSNRCSPQTEIKEKRMVSFGDMHKFNTSTSFFLSSFRRIHDTFP